MSKEAMKLALEALEAGEYYIDDLEAIVYAADDLGTHEDRAKMQEAITALREALAKPDFWEGYVPEPVKPAQDVVTNLTPTYAFFQPPKPVGAWVLDPGGVVHTQFAMYSKPTDEQIKNTEAMFGWKWKDLS